MTPRLRRITSNFVVLALTSALCLGALELGARWILATRGGGKEALESRGYSEYDPLLGWHKRPGARVTYHRREYTTEVAINSHGLRDAERDYVVPPGTCRVLAVGDSFVEAYTVAVEDGVARQLEGRLTKAARPVEVLNGGTLGYSTDQELLFYRSEGQRYGARLVLLFFHYNDIVYNDRQDYFGQAKPIFEQRPEGLHVHRFPVRPREASDAPPPAATAEEHHGSALKELLSDFLWLRAPRAYAALTRVKLLEPITPRSARLELRVYERREIPEIEQAWDKTAAILRTFAHETSTNGERFLVVYVPSRLEVQDESWQATRLMYGLGPDDWDRRHVIDHLQKLGTQDGYPVLDLTPPLRASDRGIRGRPYFEADNHWNAQGHAVAATAIEAFLAQAGWLSACGAGAAPGPTGQ